MKRIALLLTITFLSIGSVFAKPIFKGLNNNGGKTTIIIKIPASDRDNTNGLSLDNFKLYNNGQIHNAKKVNSIWGDESIVTIEFKHLSKFSNCTLSFTLNGEPVSIDIQDRMINRVFNEVFKNF